MARKVAKKTIKKTALAAVDRSFDRLAAGITPAARTTNTLQLRRIKGQLEGIERMIENDRYCVDIIMQITAARASLMSVANSLLAEHLRFCHSQAMGNGTAESDRMYQELVSLVSKMAK